MCIPNEVGRPRRNSELGGKGVSVTLLSLLPVDDVPDGLEILQTTVRPRTSTYTEITYISLNVQVLEIEGMLPDVNTNKRSQREQRVLVGGRGNLDALRLGVNTLDDGRWRQNPV